MEKKVFIGKVIIKKDTEMWNNQFEYAASFENILVPAGEYPIYAYEDDLKKRGDKVMLGWRNYIGYEGTVISGNVGGKKGDATSYHLMVYDYILGEYFLNGHDAKYEKEFELSPEWGLELVDFVSSIDNKRCFSVHVVRK